jgi:two-component system, NarL family, response regulator NreC
LAHDHNVVRAGLKALIDAQPDMEVAGAAADGCTECERVLTSRPDVMVRARPKPPSS